MQEYMARRKVPPKEIIFYRDGVGEGMYDLVCARKRASRGEERDARTSANDIHR